MTSASPERQSATSIGSRSEAVAFHEWISPAADLIFPGSCSLCSAAMPGVPATGNSSGFCEDCATDLLKCQVPACLRCARPLPLGASPAEGECPHCRRKKLHFDRVIALGVYEGRLREAVLRMKQATGELVALALGSLLAKRISEQLSELPDVTIPIPTHWSRRLGRDVNCTDLLAEALTDRLDIPGKPQALRCRRRMQKQGTLLPTERRANVRGAYAVRLRSLLEGQSVLLVDDVMTTGATAQEVAKTLRKVGVIGVSVAIVARGVGFDA